jgi:hypothetical protein
MGPTAGLDIEPQILGHPERNITFFFKMGNCCNVRQLDSYETFRTRYFTSLQNIMQVMQND